MGQPFTDRHGLRTPAIAVYNVHSGVGADGRFAPDRVLEVIRDLRADVVVLNEVDSRRELGRVGNMAEMFRKHLGGHLIPGPTLREGGGDYGNAVLTLWPVESTRLVDLRCRRREPRSAIDCLLTSPFGPVRLIATHLGLKAWERRLQMEHVHSLIEDPPHKPTILAGDLNEWSPLAPAQRKLRRVLARCRRRRTFPARFPLFALDQVWCWPPKLVRDTRAVRTRATRRASDHLPLIAELDPLEIGPRDHFWPANKAAPPFDGPPGALYKRAQPWKRE